MVIYTPQQPCTRRLGQRVVLVALPHNELRSRCSSRPTITTTEQVSWDVLGSLVYDKSLVPSGWYNVMAWQ